MSIHTIHIHQYVEQKGSTSYFRVNMIGCDFVYSFKCTMRRMLRSPTLTITFMFSCALSSRSADGASAPGEVSRRETNTAAMSVVMRTDVCMIKHNLIYRAVRTKAEAVPLFAATEAFLPKALSSRLRRRCLQARYHGGMRLRVAAVTLSH